MNSQFYDVHFSFVCLYHWNCFQSTFIPYYHWQGWIICVNIIIIILIQWQRIKIRRSNNETAKKCAAWIQLMSQCDRSTWRKNMNNICRRQHIKCSLLECIQQIVQLYCCIHALSWLFYYDERYKLHHVMQINGRKMYAKFVYKIFAQSNGMNEQWCDNLLTSISAHEFRNNSCAIRSTHEYGNKWCT